jgi:hypothetical protein
MIRKYAGHGSSYRLEGCSEKTTSAWWGVLFLNNICGISDLLPKIFLCRYLRVLNSSFSREFSSSLKVFALSR